MITMLRSTILHIMLLPSLYAAAGGYIYAGDASTLYYVSGNEIYSADTRELLYFQKGNIFFSGSSDEKQNIYLLTTNTDITQRKPQYLYESGERKAAYSFNNSKFFLQNSSAEESDNNILLLHVERTGKWLSFYSGINDSLLGYYLADSMPPSAAVFTAYTLIKKYKINEAAKTNDGRLAFADTPINKNPVNYYSIKPIWGNVTANEWIWDGQVFRPRWNADPRVAWTFDGRIVKPQWGTNIYEQYEWDGETLKPVWRNVRELEWTWSETSHMFKPAWDGSDWSKQYVIENGIVKPWSNVHPEKEWRMDGPIPVPLIILVVSGIARP